MIPKFQLNLLLVDMLAHAIDTPVPATIILISGDRDFAYAVSTLRLRRYRVAVISAGEVHPSLKAHASVFLDWHTDVLLAKVVVEDRYFHTRSNEEARPLAASSPSRRYPMAHSPFSSRFSSEDAEIDIMDHLHLHDIHKSRGLGGATPERGSKEANLNTAASNRSFSPSDSLVDEARSPTPTLRAPSRTGSAPAAVYSISECLPTSTVLSSNPHSFNGNISAPPTLLSGPQIPSKASSSLPPSPQIKKGAQDSITSGNTIVGHPPSTLLPNPTSFSVQYPHQPLPPATVPTSTSNTSVSPSFQPVIPGPPAASSKERPTAIVQPNKSIPPGFEPLVQKLKTHRSQGISRPFRSKLAVELATQANGVYRRVGVERFHQYADMAVKAGIVELGGKEAGAWIALRPEWYDAKPS